MAQTLEKLPPQSIEAEQSVLGSLLLDNEAIIRIADFIRPEDFYRSAHQIVYQAMLDLYHRGEPIDILSLSNRLKEKKSLKKIGGVTYLTEVVNAVPTASSVVHYAKIVKRKKILRDLIKASQEIMELGYNETEDVEDLVDEAEKKIFAISQQSLKQEFIPLKIALEQAFSRIDQLHKGKRGTVGIPTGFVDLDNILSGLQPSDLIILASRPSLGKTTLAMDIARYAAVRQNIPVGIFSLEMSKEQLIDRLLAAEARVSLWKLRTGKLSSKGEENDFTRLQRTFGNLEKAPIFIDDAGSSTVHQMRTLSRRLKSEGGLGLIIIDYLQLMEGTSAESRVQEISEISRSLKGLAKELNVPILALSQLSRSVEHRPKKVPILADLRESGALEQDADVVLFIYREDFYDQDSDKKNIADIIIAKHRNGPTGRIELFFNHHYVTFESLDLVHSKTEYEPVSESI